MGRLPVQPSVTKCLAGLSGATAEVVAADGTATSCTVTANTDSALTCTMPSLPAGTYQLRVVASGGYANPLVALRNAPRIASVTPPAGSLAGGQVVRIQTSGVPLATDSNATQVSIGGLPCEVQSVAADSVTCKTTRAFGAIPTTVRQMLPDACLPAGNFLHEHWCLNSRLEVCGLNVLIKQSCCNSQRPAAMCQACTSEG